jgi:hypothetical protein
MDHTSKHHHYTSNPFVRAMDILEGTMHGFEAISILIWRFVPDNQFRAMDEFGQR